MQYIPKTGTQAEAEGKKCTKEYVDNCWCASSRQYNDLCYDRSRLDKLSSILVKEQSDEKGNSYCCYCMRRLFLNDSDSGHKENVTLEHIVPHSIKEADWVRDKSQYLHFPNLTSKYITICFQGVLTDKQKTTRITGLPYPHFISYHNLVASCNGLTFESQKLQKSRCCNNKRQERFVMPLFLDKCLSDGISYTKKGELDYDDAHYDSCWFDENHLNLNNAWITLVRRIWYKVAKSEYTVQDVEQARHDKDLRQEIIDDIDSNNEILSWNNNDFAWNLFSEYSWFYQYYNNI